jgi:hypothetical protein
MPFRAQATQWYVRWRPVSFNRRPAGKGDRLTFVMVVVEMGGYPGIFLRITVSKSRRRKEEIIT